MVHDFIELCRSYPQIVIFMAIGIGYFIGKIKIFGFNLGSTAGVLLAALVVGQMNVQVPPLVKTISFALFIFTIGYKVGPQFFGALKKEGLNYIWISIFFAIVGLIVAIVLGKAFHFDSGTTAGLMAGALTQSSAIGTAEGAIKHLGVSSVQQATLMSNVAVAYAITYIFGTGGLIIFFKMVPKLMGVNLKQEAIKLEQEMSGGTALPQEPGLFSWQSRLNLRAFKVSNENANGKTVSQIEAMFPHEVAVENLKRDGKVTKPEEDTVIKLGDIVALVGGHDKLIDAKDLIGPPVEDKDAEDITGEILKICVLNKDAVGKTLGEISEKYGHGCFLKMLTRQGHELPLTKNTVLSKCDLLQVAGAQADVESFVKYLGYAERPTVKTDLVMVGWGCVFGTLLGIITIPLLGIPITLGVGGGVLVAGLVCGWLRSLRPTFGQIPGPTQWVFTDLGLNLFIACVGLVAAPRALHALQTTGIALFLAGVILTLVPHILSLFFGKFVLKLNPVLLFGALTGAGTITAALNALKEEADSPMPALGYTVPYAFGNVFLTVWGTVIVNIMR
ncbi:MAG: aspartate-alanine antiporter [Candidatus Omnitrophica bacterium]|nr:aspartate-alanine antiporter [Candidatus Omnitrophota bacterium]